jgi:hypothetical protein
MAVIKVFDIAENSTAKSVFGEITEEPLPILSHELLVGVKPVGAHADHGAVERLEALNEAAVPWRLKS